MKTLVLSSLTCLALAACSKSAPYALSTCVVSGEKLGSMGKPYSFTHEGTEVRLCCKSCRKDFEADPAKFLAKLK